MKTLKQLELTCPNCEFHFTSLALDAPEAPARRRTDFQVRSEGLQPLPFGVHLCERCGFAGPEEWFTEREVSYDVRNHVWNELTPLVSSRTLTASEKYEFAAKVALWDGASMRDVAELWLRAAWCCVDEGDVEAERYYRRHAVWAFEDSFKEGDGVAPAERASMSYLIGELWRRIGDHELAQEWFSRVDGEITDRRQQAWLVRWARQQRDEPREWFA